MRGGQKVFSITFALEPNMSMYQILSAYLKNYNMQTETKKTRRTDGQKNFIRMCEKLQ